MVFQLSSPSLACSRFVFQGINKQFNIAGLFYPYKLINVDNIEFETGIDIKGNQCDCAWCMQIR